MADGTVVFGEQHSLGHGTSLPRPPGVRRGRPGLRSPFLPRSHRHTGNRRRSPTVFSPNGVGVRSAQRRQSVGEGDDTRLLPPLRPRHQRGRFPGRDIPGPRHAKLRP
ncbi:hypothetical protein E2C11_31935 [Streptomyces lavendulae]|nr:hypothetical protein E2C11_31935 [Streptomyces lavendulae]